MVVVDDVHQPETGNDKLANLGPPVLKRVDV